MRKYLLIFVIIVSAFCVVTLVDDQDHIDGTTALTSSDDLPGFTYSGLTTKIVGQLEVPTHNVIYDVSGGSAFAPEQESVKEGASFVIATYSGTKTGFNFIGWDDGELLYFPGEEYVMGCYDVSLTALWVETTHSGICGDDVKWYLLDGILTVYGSGDMYDYSYGTAPWYGYATQMTDLVLFEGITSIGDYAFYMCAAFQGTAVLPSSLISLGVCSFTAAGFSSISVPESNSYYSSVDGIVFSKDGTKIIQASGYTAIADYVIPSTVTTVGDYAFSLCMFMTGTITIPSSVTSIGSGAFYWCKGLTGVLTIPSGVVSIGDGAFAASGFSSILVSESNPNYSSEEGILFNKERTCLIQATIGNIKTNYVIPSGVVSIGGHAFLDCGGFTGSFTIPSGITSICDYAFLGCWGITSLRIGADVSGVSNLAFDGWFFFDTDGKTKLLSVDDLVGNAFVGTKTHMVKSVQYSVTYDVDGGSRSAPAEKLTLSGESFVVDSYLGTKYGCMFGGWCDGIAVYEPGSIYTIDESDVEFTAVWIELDSICVECSDLEWWDGAGDATASVSITSNPGISALCIEVTYDGMAMTLKGVESSGLMELTAVNLSNNPCVLYLETETIGEDVTGTGLLATLVFEVDVEAEKGVYPITITVSDYSRDDGILVPVDAESGSITIRYMPGDLNGDGVVSSADSLLLRKYLSHWTVTIVGNADLNGDGEVDALDSLLLKMYLAKWDVTLH